MKLQVDITADNLAYIQIAIREVYDKISGGQTRGTIGGHELAGATGLFELLDSQPAAE